MIIRFLTLTIIGCLLPLSESIAQKVPVPPFVERGLPSAGHQALKDLAGTWRVEKSIFVAGGTASKPVVATLTTRRELVADGRFLQDITEGTMPDSSRYWRMGTLGYSSIDKRYEWVTVDAVNANMMVYQGEPNSGQGFPITTAGTFTDSGILGEQTVGKAIKQKTIMRIEGPDRHVFEMYFQAPGGKEFLADRAVYTRAPL